MRGYCIRLLTVMCALFAFGCSDTETGGLVDLESGTDEPTSLESEGGENANLVGSSGDAGELNASVDSKDPDEVDGDGTSPIALEFDPEVLDFGVLAVGAEFVSGAVTVRNPEVTPVAVKQVVKTNNLSVFLLSSTSLSLYGKGEESFEVLVNPKEVGAFEEELHFLDEFDRVIGILLVKVSVVPPECQDVDGDLHGDGCPAGDDCNESDPNNYFGGIEVCDNQDNDCDGLADEDFAEVGTECIGGLGDCVTPGQWVCNEQGTGVLCSADVTAGGFEICNGIDDDCDGAIDETFPDFNAPCFVGVGACERLGKLVCSEDGAKLVCNVEPGVPELEQCFDEIDNDCDGVLDEGELEICDDGLDNDCDGEVDESGSDWGETFFARSFAGKTISIYPSNGDGTFEESYKLDFGDQNYYGVAGVGDFDGDLYLDVVAVQRVTFGKELCDPDTPCPTGYTCKGRICEEKCTIGGVCSNPNEECVDTNYNFVNNDTICMGERKVFLVQKGCEEELKMTELLTLPPGEGLGRAIDADGNGHLDFLALGHHSDAQGILWLNDGEMGFTRTEGVFNYTALLSWKYTLGETSRDLTGDGIVDVMGARFTSGGSPPTELFLFEGKGDGTFFDPVKQGEKFPYPANLVTANDFDKDGDMDLVGGLDDDGQPGGAWMIVQDSGDWLPSYPIFDVAPTMNTGSEKPGIGNGASFDFDGDTYPDVLVAFTPEECGGYVWGCTQVSNPSDLCYGGNCRKVALLRNHTGSPCEDGYGCFEGSCEPNCAPECSNKECGDNGCYGSCGTCEGGQICNNGKCVSECVPDCSDKTCGPNGCGGVCGYCEGEGACVDGACLSGCVPNCVGKECGDDGCGGVCSRFGEPEVVVFDDNPSTALYVPTNVPPTQPEISIVPADAVAGQGLECVVLVPSIDLDAVSYEYRWFRDGVFAKDIGNVAQVAPGLTLDGEEWQCVVRGSDGLEWGRTAFATLVIGGQ